MIDGVGASTRVIIGIQVTRLVTRIKEKKRSKRMHITYASAY